jgi:hypothetical protein
LPQLSGADGCGCPTLSPEFGEGWAELLWPPPQNLTCDPDFTSITQSCPYGLRGPSLESTMYAIFDPSGENTASAAEWSW